MAKLGISTGTTPDDGTGTSLLVGAARINNNFDEIYDYFGTGTNLDFAGGRFVETDAGIHTLSSVGIGTTNPTYSLTVKGNTEVTGLTSFVNPNDGTDRLEVAYYAQPTLRFLSGSAMAGTIEGQMGGLHLKSVATKAIEINDNAAVFGSATNYYDVQLNKANNGSTKVGANIQFLPSTGIVSATSFRGDGSQLTGISASGTGGKFVANATGIHTLSSVGIGTTTATGAVNTGNTSVLNVGVVTANNFYGTFRGDGTNITGIGVTNVKNDGGDVKLQTNTSGVSITGIATATSFVGDGSGLTGIVGSGAGIVVKDSGSAVGTAGTINFAESLSVSAISGAAVTVSFTGDTNYWGQNDTGIHTTGSVGIGTTNARPGYHLTVDGNLKLIGAGQGGGTVGGGNLDVTGVSTFLQTVDFKSDFYVPDSKTAQFGDNNDLWIWHDATGHSMIRNGGGDLRIRSNSFRIRSFDDSTDYLTADLTGEVSLFHNNQKRLATSGVGVTVYSGSSTEAKVDIKPGTGSFNGAVGAATTIDEWKLSDNEFRSAEYQLTVTNSNGGYVQSQKVLVMHDNTNAFYSEWAVMYGGQGARLVSVGATTSGGYVRLEVTPQAGYSGITSYFFSRTAIG